MFITERYHEEELLFLSSWQEEKIAKELHKN